MIPLRHLRAGLLRLAGAIASAAALYATAANAEDVPRVTVATHRFGGVQLMTVGIDGSNPMQLTNDPDDATQGTWCPDGSKIAYGVGPRLAGKIKVMDADGKNAHILFDGGGPQRTPQWSPDGKQIAFSMRVDQNARNFNIFVINADGSGLTNITDAPVAALDPGWSPDSSMFVYVSHGPNLPGRLWVMKADGTDKHDLLGRNLDVAIYPSWTSDGKQVTFGCPDQNKQIQLMQVNLDGSGTTTLTHGPKPHSYAAWSPDGQYLAYVSDPGGHSCDLGIYDVLADEHHVVLKGEVFEELHRDARPSWVPKKP
jgi:TolB protein